MQIQACFFVEARDIALAAMHDDRVGYLQIIGLLPDEFRPVAFSRSDHVEHGIRDALLHLCEDPHRIERPFLFCDPAYPDDARGACCCILALAVGCVRI